jgi:hypothetical protein
MIRRIVENVNECITFLNERKSGTKNAIFFLLVQYSAHHVASDEYVNRRNFKF